MVQVPRFTSVDLQPMSMPQVQAPRVIPMEDQRPREIAQAGEAMQQIGGAAIRYGVYEQRKRQQLQNQLDDAASNEAFSQYYDFSVNEMSGKDTGYQYKVGKAAAEAYEPTRKSLTDKFTEIENSLGNDVQKQMFRMKAGRYATGVYAEMDSHYEKQVRNHDLAQADVLAQNYGQIAMQNYQAYLREQDPERKAAFENSYLRFKTGMLGQVDRVADLNGIPAQDPVREAAKQKASDALHSGIVESLIANKQPANALRYLEKYQGEVTETAKTTLQERIVRASTTDQAVNAALGVKAAGGNLKQRQDALTEMFKAGSLTADSYKEAKGIVSYDYDIEVDDAKRMQAEGVNQVMQWAAQNPGKPLSMAPQDLQSMVFNYGIGKQAMDATKAVQEMSYSNSLDEVRNMLASSDGRAKLSGMTENEFAVEYMHRMNSADFTYAKAMHSAARGNPTVEQVSVVSLKDRVRKAASDSKAITSKTGTELSNEDRINLINFEMKVDEKLRTLTADKKRPLTDKEIQAELDGMVFEARSMVKIDVSWERDPQMRTADLSNEQLQSAYVEIDGEYIYLRPQPMNKDAKFISSQEYEAISLELDRRGLGTNPYNIVEVYKLLRQNKKQ